VPEGAARSRHGATEGKDYFHFSRGTFFAQWNPLALEGGIASWIEKRGKAAVEQGKTKAAPLGQAAQGEAGRTNGPKRTSSRGSGNA
jgi:hypothetical protein